MARAAIGLACVAAVLLALAAGGLGGAGAGAVVSFAACVTAGVARVKGDRWALLWVPLLLFPALLVSSPFWV
jgi:hypothetical protein